MARPVALVDCNNFYWRCELMFQPKWRGRPGVVLSNNDGCVIARSPEAKSLGIKMGDAWHLREREFRRWGVIVRSSNYTLYGDMSSRVMRILSAFTPELEVYSIDEAFLGLSGFPDLEGHARAIHATLGRMDIPVCVGVSTTKTLAKVANRTAKQDPARGGVAVLMDEASQTAALAAMELADVWGIGRQLLGHLAKLGITTPLQLRAACPTLIRQRFNVVVQRTVLELRGVPCLALGDDDGDRQTIMRSRSFGRPVERLDELAEAMTAYVSRAAEKMRGDGLATSALTVMVMTSPHRPEDGNYSASRAVPLTIATTDTARLIRAALWGLRSIYRPGCRYAKCGVTLLNLQPAATVQQSLFLQPDRPERVQIMAAIDTINRRYGRDRIRYACTGLDRDWGLRAAYLSPRSTTRWDELPQVN